MSKNNINSEIPETFKNHISFKFGSYSVRNDKNKKLITFGRFSSCEVACAATELLIKFDWNILEVANDPLSSYLDKFWVFKVMNNKLIFDRKFSSFENAVEYMEINTKCNDYHNDVLHKKKRKPKYSNLPEIKHHDVNNIENIYDKNGLFVVKYKPHGKIYGAFNSIDEAIVAKNLLIENNWKFSSSIEMKFYDSFYWIFRIKNNILYFIDKFESYEDALDCLDSNKLDVDSDEGLNFGKSVKKLNKKYLDNIKKESNKLEENIGRVIKSINESKNNNTKKNRKKRGVRNRPTNNYRIPKIKCPLSKKDIEIKEIEVFDKENLQIDASNFKSEVIIIKFQDNTLKDYYSISFLNNGEIEISDNFDELTEFKYILKILNTYGWNLDKIGKLSLIHYIGGHYYILTSFNDKLIISGEFDTYVEAEENIKFLYDYYSHKLIRTNIKKHGDYYKYYEKHNGRIFEINYQKSLETLKAVIDIFDYYNWNPNNIKENDIYHYHGLYWNIDYLNHYIKLKGRFYSKNDAIKNKLS